MTRRRHILVFALAALLAGCQTSSTFKPAPVASMSEVVRNNCYSLLHQLLDQEKDVTLLRFIKRENKDLKALMKRVGETSKLGAKQLEDFARADHSLDLGNYGLPEGEMKTRDGIAALKQKELLHFKGDKMELALLLDQIEALNYGSELAKIASNNDSVGQRARYLSDLSDELKNLRDEITSRLTLAHPTP